MRQVILIVAVLWAFSLNGKPQHQPKAVLEHADSLISHYQYEPAKTYILNLLADTSSLQPVMRSKLWNRLSAIAIHFGDGESAMEYGLKALKEVVKSSDEQAIAEVQISILHAKQNLGQDLDVPEYIIQLSELAASKKSMNITHSIHYINGVHMTKINDFQSASNHFAKALEIAQKYLPKTNVIQDLLMLSACSFTIGKTDTAFFLVDKAQKISIQSGDSVMLAKSLMTRSYLHLASGNLDEGRALAESAAAIAQPLGHHLVTAQAIKQQMVSAMLEGNFNSAIQSGLQAMVLIENHPNQIHKAVLDSLLYASYQALGDKDQALYHFSRFHQNVLSSSQKYKEYEARQLEYLKEIHSKKLELENQNLLLLSERRKKNALFLLNLLLISIALGAASYFTLRQNQRRKLFFKEQLISGLMEESAVRRTVYEEAVTTSKVQSDEEDMEADEFSENDFFKRKLLFNDFLELMEKEKVYLNPLMDRKTIIGLLGTNRKYLNEALKFFGDSSLIQILNRYRVFEAKKIIQHRCLAGEMENLEDVYSHSGFAAKSSYYRIFKGLTGISPREYAQEFTRSVHHPPSSDEQEDGD